MIVARATISRRARRVNAVRGPRSGRHASGASWRAPFATQPSAGVGAQRGPRSGRHITGGAIRPVLSRWRAPHCRRGAVLCRDCALQSRLVISRRTPAPARPPHASAITGGDIGAGFERSQGWRVRLSAAAQARTPRAQGPGAGWRARARRPSRGTATGRPRDGRGAGPGPDRCQASTGTRASATAAKFSAMWRIARSRAP